MISPPTTESELWQRAQVLSGKTLGQLASDLDARVPADLRRHKGWVGELVEQALGATAGSRSMPDFPQLGVELKTLPVTRGGQPLETTFVCTIDLLEVGDTEWEQSRVWRKLQRVLWVPVLALREIPLGDRTIGAPILWSPNAQEQADLRWDWEELAGVIGRGGAEDISARLGRYLQIRPKGANAQARRPGTDSEGRRVPMMPRGFYLRTQFTTRIVAANLAIAKA